MIDGSLNALGDAMDLSALRHQVIANNIANARTPGFRASDVFGARVEELRGVRSNGVAFVDMGQEMARMTDNAVRFQSLGQLASARLRLYQTIVHDGRR